MVNFLKDEILQFKRWSQNCAFLFDGLIFSSVKGNILVSSPDPKFRISIRLIMISRATSTTLIFIYYFTNKIEREAVFETEKLGFRKPLRYFLIFVLVWKEMSPSYGNNKKKVFFSTFANWGRVMNNLLTNVINDKGSRFFKKTYFKRLSSSWNFVQSEQITKQW